MSTEPIYINPDHFEAGKHKALRRFKGLSIPARAVLAEILCFDWKIDKVTGAHRGFSFPSQETIADNLGVHVNTVAKYTREIKEKSPFFKDVKYIKTQTGTKIYYVFNWDFIRKLWIETEEEETSRRAERKSDITLKEVEALPSYNSRKSAPKKPMSAETKERLSRLQGRVGARLQGDQFARLQAPVDESNESEINEDEVIIPGAGPSVIKEKSGSGFPVNGKTEPREEKRLTPSVGRASSRKRIDWSSAAVEEASALAEEMNALSSQFFPAKANFLETRCDGPVE